MSIATDVGEIWLPEDCQIVTPALLHAGTWEPAEGAALARSLAPGMTVVDVGAHVGYFALLAAQLVGPTGAVVAVEPAPHNFALLEANVERSGLTNIRTVNAAAWHTSGEIELALSPSNSGDHRVGLSTSPRTKVRTRALALDELLASESAVDFIVLDTQGSEGAVVAGMRETIARWRPRMQVEFWPAGIREFGDDPADLLATYAQLGYDVAVLGDDTRGDRVATAEAARGGFVTLVLNHRDARRRPHAARPTLGVCVPTHDGRRDVLESALESVVGQISPETRERVHVYVSDNASSDGTEQLVAQLGERHPGLITYRRNDTDMGAGANLLRSVELAQSDYVWLLGSDDQLEPHALARALELLDAYPSAVGMTVNKLTLDASMTQVVGPPVDPFAPPRAHEPRVYADAEAVLDECGLAHGLTSTQICHRPSWIAAAADDPLKRTRLAPHLLLIERMVRSNPRWIWCPDRLVRQRCDGATPREHGYSLYAYMLAILDEVEPLWAELFGRAANTYGSLLERWCEAVLAPSLIVRYKREPGHRLRDDARMLIGFTRRAWRSRYFQRRSLPALLVPHPLAGRALAAWRRLRR